MISKNGYAIALAKTVSLRANCLGRKVGAILMREGVVVSTGYNGTPFNVTNCMDGGCLRCQVSRPGRDYDMCLCVHAEQNCILSAAKQGHATEGTVMYSTLQPCFICLREMVQAGVYSVFFATDWNPPKEYWDVYDALTTQMDDFRRIEAV